jgi:hypothetical protein
MQQLQAGGPNREGEPGPKGWAQLTGWSAILAADPVYCCLHDESRAASAGPPLPGRCRACVRPRTNDFHGLLPIGLGSLAGYEAVAKWCGPTCAGANAQARRAHARTCKNSGSPCALAALRDPPRRHSTEPLQ